MRTVAELCGDVGAKAIALKYEVSEQARIWAEMELLPSDKILRDRPGNTFGKNTRRLFDAALYDRATFKQLWRESLSPLVPRQALILG
jgi:hypothetical protein